MKKIIFNLLIIGVFFMTAAQSTNPFYQEWKTPYGTPPFDKIKQDHYLPAFKQGIEEQNKEIAAILNSDEEPTFENTVEALEYSGGLLTKVSNVFFQSITMI